MSANIPFKSGGVSFILKLAETTQTIASGQTGLLATITPPSGQKVRITNMAVVAISQLQSGISIAINGADVITEKSIIADQLISDFTNRFGIGGSSGSHHVIEGQTDEPITITKNAGNTTQAIYYSFEFGV